VKYRVPRTIAGCMGLAISGIALSSAASAAGSLDGGVRIVGTSFTRDAREAYCGRSSGCTYDAHFPLDTGSCGKVASARLRFQRDLLPDVTQAAFNNYSSCANYYWNDARSKDNHGHHMDAKVSSGTGKVHFFYTDIR
jgi:hypothetical protein